MNHQREFRRRKRRQKKDEGRYTFADALGEAIFWLPELLFLPFRLLFWLLRGFGRFIGDLF